jgi:RNA polymerase sigma-70 factor (ECF subfamily)
VTVTETAFEEHRAHLWSVAYRMLGSFNEADDAVQECWLRLARADTTDVRNLRGWLTTVISRICLDMLRARAARREDPLDAHVPDPIVTHLDDAAPKGPEQLAVEADAVGLALLVVLDTLSPAERLAFVLHDVFAVPFEEIATVVDRSPDAAKQLASRARRRVQAARPGTSADLRRQRAVVEAFTAASRNGDFAALFELLDPDVTLRADAGTGPLGPSRVVHGAAGVVAQARRFASMARYGRLVLVNGSPGVLVSVDGRPFAVIAMDVRDDKIVQLDILADPARLAAVVTAG